MNAMPIAWRSGVGRKPKCQSRGRAVIAATPATAATTQPSSPIVDRAVIQGESSWSSESTDWATAITSPTITTDAVAPSSTARNGAHTGQRGKPWSAGSEVSGGGSASAVSGTDATHLEYARELRERLDHGGGRGVERGAGRTLPRDQHRADSGGRGAGHVVGRRIAHVHGRLRPAAGQLERRLEQPPVGLAGARDGRGGHSVEQPVEPGVVQEARQRAVPVARNHDPD